VFTSAPLPSPNVPIFDFRLSPPTLVEIPIQDGFPSLNLREIARRMGIRVSAINHYYSTRENLGLDVPSGVLNSYEALFEPFRLPSKEPAEVRLRAFINTILDDILALKTTCLFPELWALAGRDERVAQMVDAIYIRSRWLVTRFIGQINPSLDLRTRENLALFLTASLEGLTILGKSRQRYVLRHRNLVASLDILPAFDPFAARQFQHQHLVEPGDGGEVEAVEAFRHREPGGLDAPLHHAALAVDQLHLDQPGEVAHMVHALQGALPGELLMLAQDRRKLQRLQMGAEQDLGGFDAHAAFSPSQSRPM